MTLASWSGLAEPKAFARRAMPSAQKPAGAEDAERALSRDQPVAADAAAPTPANQGSASAVGAKGFRVGCFDLTYPDGTQELYGDPTRADTWAQGIERTCEASFFCTFPRKLQPAISPLTKKAAARYTTP